VILHVYTVVWNESYMMPYFLRHYEKVADKILVFDDFSTDGTRDIVKAHPKAELHDWPCESGMIEPVKAKFFSREYRTRSRGIADWVICVDCDEFIYHPDLRSVLEEQKALGTKAIKPDQGLIVGATTTPHTDGQLYDACPYGFERRAYAKPVIFTPDIDVWFGHGQHHSAVRPDVPKVRGTGIVLLHCCYLSREWILEHLKVRFARMPQHELDRVNAGGLTHDVAVATAMRDYGRMIRKGPWR